MSALAGNTGAWNLSPHERMQMFEVHWQEVDTDPLIERDHQQKVQQFVQRTHDYALKLLANHQKMLKLIAEMVRGLKELDSLSAMRERNGELKERQQELIAIRQGLQQQLLGVAQELDGARAQKQRLIDKMHALNEKLNSSTGQSYACEAYIGQAVTAISLCTASYSSSRR